MNYQHPGVYIEHVPSSALAIETASTSVAAFIGHVSRGDRVTKDKGSPTFISSISDYATLFGPPGGGQGGIRNLQDKADYMGHAVNLFFANGGAKAYIVPIANGDGERASCSITFTLDDRTGGTSDDVGTPATGDASGGVADAPSGGKKWTLTLTARLPGNWANELVIELEKSPPEASVPHLNIAVGVRDSSASGGRSAATRMTTVIEQISGLIISLDAKEFAARVESLSSLLTASLAESDVAAGETAKSLPLTVSLTGGKDTPPPKPQDYEAALGRLRDYRDISILLLPGSPYKNGTDAATANDHAITHCEFMQNRLLVMEADASVPLKTPADVTKAGLPTSSYAVLYHPHVYVSNPYYDAETASNLPKKFEIGPAAAAAGVWARIDSSRGVWKAPAGLEAEVRGTLGPTILVGNDLQDNLNDSGVNCLRAIIGPTVVWGARTLATKAKPIFRYVPVRRTQSMIGESLYRALQAAVFEPNDYKLWGALRASVGDFMDRLHRAGAFQGEKASDAYFVRCGLSSTMTQADIDAGIVRVVAGFAPLKPAEFVVVEIQQKVGQSA